MKRVYSIADVCALLAIPRSTFFTLKRAGKMPFLDEITPRIGRRIRYRADLVDRWLSGQWGQSRSFASHRKAS